MVRSVAVPVVDVRPMPVDMGQGLVGVQVDMGLAPLVPRMRMHVVFVAGMEMGVDQRLVGMPMHVVFPAEDADTAEHEE